MDQRPGRTEKVRNYVSGKRPAWRSYPPTWHPAPRLRYGDFQASMAIARYQSWWPTATWRVKARWYLNALKEVRWDSKHSLGYRQNLLRQHQERKFFLAHHYPILLPPKKFERYWMEKQGIAQPFHYYHMTHRDQHLWKTDLIAQAQGKC